jgi:maleate cis-trans isomerase
MAGAYGKMPDDKKMQAEMDLGTLVEAERIKKDPARMKMVMQCKKEKMAAMEAISK